MMSQNISPRHKIQRLNLQSPDSNIKNQNLLNILEKYKTKLLKNKGLTQHASNHLNSSYKSFLHKQDQYKDYTKQTQTRIRSQRHEQDKENKQTSLLKQKKRSLIRSNKKDLEEIDEKNRKEVFDKQQDRLQKGFKLHQTHLSQSYFTRSNINADSSMRIRAQKKKLQQQFSKDALDSSTMKLERVKSYLKQKSAVQSLYIGKTDKSVDIVLQKNQLLQSQKFAQFIQKYLTSRRNQQIKYQLQKSIKKAKLDKRKKQYQKRRVLANQKKDDLIHQRSFHVNSQLEQQLGKFSNVQKHRKSMQISWSKHIQDNRNKIAKILKKNQELKKETRQRKEKFIEVHKEKIQDINKFKKEFQRIRQEVNNTFLTS